MLIRGFHGMNGGAVHIPRQVHSAYIPILVYSLIFLIVLVRRLKLSSVERGQTADGSLKKSDLGDLT